MKFGNAKLKSLSAAPCGLWPCPDHVTHNVYIRRLQAACPLSPVPQIYRGRHIGGTSPPPDPLSDIRPSEERPAPDERARKAITCAQMSAEVSTWETNRPLRASCDAIDSSRSPRGRAFLPFYSAGHSLPRGVLAVDNGEELGACPGRKFYECLSAGIVREAGVRACFGRDESSLRNLADSTSNGKFGKLGRRLYDTSCTPWTIFWRIEPKQRYASAAAFRIPDGPGEYFSPSR